MSALRYAQDGANLPRLRALMRRLAPDVVLVNNGGYPAVRAAAGATGRSRRRRAQSGRLRA